MKYGLDTSSSTREGQYNWRHKTGYRYVSSSSGPLMPMDEPIKWWQIWKW